MRSTFTLIALLGFALLGTAQRDVDWEVVELIEPQALNSTTRGTEFRVIAVVKNNGPDTVYVGDSILFQTILFDEQGVHLLSFPRGYYYTLIDSQLNPYDTMHLATGINRMNAYPKATRSLQIQFTSWVFNESTNDFIYQDTLFQNNTILTDCMWLNPENSNVGVEEYQKGEIFALSPNPAAGNVMVRWPSNSLFSDAIHIRVFDMSGRVVLARELDSHYTYCDLNTSDLAPGLYNVLFSSGGLRHSKRLVVGQDFK